VRQRAKLRQNGQVQRVASGADHVIKMKSPSRRYNANIGSVERNPIPRACRMHPKAGQGGGSLETGDPRRLIERPHVARDVPAHLVAQCRPMRHHSRGFQMPVRVHHRQRQAAKTHIN
jgi:hypothetical protein